MFDLLKKKISSFVNAFTKKEEEKPPLPPFEPAAPVQIERVERGEISEVPEVPSLPLPKSEEQKPASFVAPADAQSASMPEPKPGRPEVPILKPLAEQPKIETPAPKPPPPDVSSQLPSKPPAVAIPVEEKKTVPPAPIVPVPEAKPPEKKFEPFAAPKPVLESERKEREFAPKLGIISAIKSVFTNKVKISEAETRELFSEFEIALLESDVSPDTALALVDELKKRLVGREVERGKVGEAVKNEIGLALQSLLSQKDFDFFGKLREKKSQGAACRILFLGPNGAGKTTTISKVAALLKSRGFSSVISASDTFRAAAIEQAVFHGEKLGIKVVKHSYGADPAAVAFDAIKHAQANKLDVVLIDTAGRQETNRNLVEEMKKISRVCAPDIKLFVGEAVSGNALVEQVRAFKDAVGVDGIILTKVDCDAKGGNSLSISRETGVPIVFIGTGQEYSDLAAFDPEFVVKKVLEA